MIVASKAKSLVIAGAWLFLIGLLEGAAVNLFVNPRMALSAHLTAVQSGMALMILGMVWPLASWSATVENASFRATVAGMYGLWLGLTLSAATGASDALPMAGQGYGANPTTEVIVSAFVILSSIAMTIGWLLFAYGLTKRR